MIAIAADERLEGADDVVLELLVGTPPRRAIPLVEALVPHEDAHLVAEVEELGRGAVVRGAERVDAHVLEDLELATRGGTVERHAERTEVRVVADALQLHAASVQVQSVRRQLDRADAVAELLSAQFARVEVRIVDIPETRLSDLEIPLVVRAVEVLPGDGDERLLGGDGRRTDEDGRRVGILGTVHGEADVAVDACAWVPAALVVARVGRDLDNVLALLQRLRDLDAEAHVAVVPSADIDAVHLHLRRGHYAVELEERAPALLQRLRGERAAIMSDADPRQLARVLVTVLLERALDRPVMRHLDRATRRLTLLAELPCAVQRLDERLRREDLSVGAQTLAERRIGNILNRAPLADRKRRGGSRDLSEREEHRLHADRAERHVRCREANRHEEVPAFRALRDDRAVVDRIGTAAVNLHVALVVHEPVRPDVTAHVVRVHRIGRHRDRARRHGLAAAMVLGHHEVSDHAPRLTDVELALPAVAEAVRELVLARAPLRDGCPHILRHARMVGKRPHQPALVVQMLPQDLLALRVACLRPRPVAADEVRREAVAVVRVRLAVRHLRIDPRQLPRAVAVKGVRGFRREMAKEEFVIALIVVRGLLERDAVLGDVRQAHPEAVGLHAPVAVAVLLLRIVRLDVRQEARLRITLLHIRIDALLDLVVDRVLLLDAADRLAVERVRLTSDDIRDTRCGHQVAFVRRVDEHLAAVLVAAQRLDGLDSPVFDFDSRLRLTVEIFAAANFETVASLPALEDFERGMGFKGPHRAVALRAEALSVRRVLLGLLLAPVLRVPVVRGDVAVEVKRDSAEGGLVADVRLAEPARRESADAGLGRDDDARDPHALRLHRRGNRRGGGAVDDKVGGMDGGTARRGDKTDGTRQQNRIQTHV